MKNKEIKTPNGLVVSNISHNNKTDTVIISYKEKEISYGDIEDHIHSTKYPGEIIIDFQTEKNKYNRVQSVTTKTDHIIAYIQLLNTAEYLNGGQNSKEGDTVYTLTDIATVFEYSLKAITHGDIYFKTKELAEQAIKILGKETIKLALTPM